MRDGLFYNQYLSRCKAEINRSVFVYMVTSPKYTHTNQFEYGKYDKWLSAMGVAVRMMRTHTAAETRLLRQYALGRAVTGRDNFNVLLTIGAIDVEKLLEAQLPRPSVGAGAAAAGRKRTHDTDYRPYVDFDGSGNYYLCFVNAVCYAEGAEVGINGELGGGLPMVNVSVCATNVAVHKVHQKRQCVPVKSIPSSLTSPRSFLSFSLFLSLSLSLEIVVH
jgi:hypothetical protein